MIVVVTGANGLVGSRLCRTLTDTGLTVRAVVRRQGTAPPGVEERVGDFTDEGFASSVLKGAQAAVTTVHPMAADEAAQRQVGVVGTTTFARAAAAAGVERLVHVSTAAVYDRSPGVGDVDESAPLVGDDAGDYPVTKRDADLSLEGVGGLTRVLLRPPAVLGPAPSSIWNTLRPRAFRDDEGARHGIAEQSFAWVHVDDLVALAAGLATGRLTGPEVGGCTAVNAAGGTATMRDYLEAVAAAVGVDPVWDEGEAWTGRILADRARSWGWQPKVSLDQALDELARGLRTT